MLAGRRGRGLWGPCNCPAHLKGFLPKGNVYSKGKRVPPKVKEVERILKKGKEEEEKKPGLALWTLLTQGQAGLGGVSGQSAE